MSLITILVGISGSGKTTVSDTLLKNKDTIRINRDDTRKLLFGASQSDMGYYSRKDFRNCENLVSETLDDVLYNALNKDLNVIIDNTNLEAKYINEILFKFNHLADILIEFVDVDLGTAQNRVLKRNNFSDMKDVEYISRQYNQLQKLKKDLWNTPFYHPKTNPQVVFNSLFPATYIVDIDGTVALKGDRDIFDDSKLHLDTEILSVGHIVRSLSLSGFKIVYVSGRQDSCKETTTQWLKDNDLWMADSEIYMRKAKDQRNDSIVKEEIVLNDLLPRYNVIGVLDDRIGVTRNFHKLGMFVLNVNQNFVKF